LLRLISVLSPPPILGEADSRDLKLAPNSLLSLPPASVTTHVVFRRKAPARRGPAPKVSPTQVLPESDFKLPCRRGFLSPSPPSQGATRRPARRFPQAGPAPELPSEQTGNRWPCLPAAMPPPLGPQPKVFASSRGDFQLARQAFLPRGIVWMSVPLDSEPGAQPAPRLPPNICILTLAMMIAGIPTVPVPGVREEDMISAAQNFVAESLPSGSVDQEGAPQGGWASVPHLGLACKRDRQRKRAASRSLFPLFLTQLEK
ncbi:spermatogenesis-associated protein 25, partial [Sphaerodactylus townsendi]|uniref:spermatogenesis-associated protein 25 n=1 Tax=Sphaerodactylus townsendi TaxID=933632 RepID=UPI002025E104